MCVLHFGEFLSLLDKHVYCTHLFIDVVLKFYTFGISL